MFVGVLLRGLTWLVFTAFGLMLPSCAHCLSSDRGFEASSQEIRVGRGHHDYSEALLVQQANIQVPSPGNSKTIRLEIEQNNVAFGFSFFFTTIAIGTPPQPFTVLLDLGYGGVLARSVDCELCGREIFSYNHSASSTSRSTGETFELPLEVCCARGQLFTDDLMLVSSPFHNITFGAIDEFYGEFGFLLILEEFCDGQVAPYASPNCLVAYR